MPYDVRRATPLFRVSEHADKTPFIIVENAHDAAVPPCMIGFLAFDLPPGTTRERAEEVRQFLADNIVKMIEH